MTLPLAIGVAVGHPAWGALASMGGFAGFYGSDTPYRYRARLVAGIGAALTLGVLLGGLASTRGWLAPLVAGAVAGATSFVCQAAEIPPPREYLIVLATLAATGIPVPADQALWNAGLTAAGAAVGWLVTMSPALGRARAPERRAVRAALEAVAGLLARTGGPDAGAARHQAVTAVRRARRAVIQGVLPADHRLTRSLTAIEELLEAALHVEVEASAPLDTGWATAVRALIPAVARRTAADVQLSVSSPASGGGSVSSPASGGGSVSSPTAGGGSASSPAPGPLPDAIEQVRAALAGADTAAPDQELTGLPAWPGIRPQLRAAARGHSVILPAAARLGIAVAAGAGIGRALGLDHSYWVGLTAAAVLLATNSANTLRRSVHRIAGTVAGVALAYTLLAGHRSWVVVVAGVALCQFASEMIITASYGLAVVGITVLALVLFHIGTPGADVGVTIGARITDTVLGAVLALILRSVLWPRATAARLPQVQGRTLRSVGRVLCALWSDSGDGRDLGDGRRLLQSELATLRAVHTDALADDRAASPDTDLRWPVTVAIEELAFLALSLPRYRNPPPPDTVWAFRRSLNEIAGAVDGYASAPAAVTPVPGYPRTSAALGVLAAAVTDADRHRFRCG
ncbi:FUSC family protein [Planosporangium mesophilum]|nr:FUSC family protein [Planosporangium mesophilum]NJC84360.1 FUSC family protein [Planosporangium mesophilum]